MYSKLSTCNWRIIIGDVFTAHTFRNTSHRENQGPPRRAALNTKLMKDFSLGSRATKNSIRIWPHRQGEQMPTSYFSISTNSAVHQYNCPIASNICNSLCHRFAISKICQSVLRIDAVHSARCQNDLASTLDHNRICGAGFPGVSREQESIVGGLLIYLQAPWYVYILYIYVNKIYTA